MYCKNLRILLLGSALVATAGCATNPEWAVWMGHPAHFASGDHAGFSMRNQSAPPIKATPEDLELAREQGWWGGPFETRPVVVEARPVSNEARPVADETQPAVDGARPVMDETRPVVVEAQPVVNGARPMADVAGRWTGTWSGFAVYALPRTSWAEAEFTQSGSRGEGRLVLADTNTADVPEIITLEGLQGVRVALEVKGSTLTMKHLVNGHRLTGVFTVEGDRMVGRFQDSTARLVLVRQR